MQADGKVFISILTTQCSHGLVSDDGKIANLDLEHACKSNEDQCPQSHDQHPQDPRLMSRQEGAFIPATHSRQIISGEPPDSDASGQKV